MPRATAKPGRRGEGACSRMRHHATDRWGKPLNLGVRPGGEGPHPAAASTRRAMLENQRETAHVIAKGKGVDGQP
jgi:hypothetical protein